MGIRHRLLILKMKVMQKYALHAYPVMALMVATLTGCAWIPAKPLVQGRPRRSRYRPVPVANGSIFQSAQPINYGYQPLFEDRRPRNIGDTLTIVLQENVSASKARRQMPAATAKPALVLIRYRVICRDYSVIPARIWRPPAATL